MVSARNGGPALATKGFCQPLLNTPCEGVMVPLIGTGGAPVQPGG